MILTEKVDDHLPQDLESPKGVQISTSPIIYILPRSQDKEIHYAENGLFPVLAR